MKILITGGHLTPALSLIDYIQTNYDGVDLLYASRVYSQKNLEQLSIELQEIEKHKITYIVIRYLTRLSSTNIFHTLLKPFKLVLSILHSIVILSNHKPDIVVSFGSYVAVPICIAARFKKIPVITHEQTRVMGVANKLIAKFANLVAVSYPTMVVDKKYVYTGMPVRKKIIKNSKARKPTWIGEIDLPIILVLGGNQGSLKLNWFIRDNLVELINKYIVIHSCGNPTNKYDYEQVLNDKKASLSQYQRKHYYVYSWLEEKDLAWIYQNTYACLSRSGANTVWELALNLVPTIFVPLKNSRHSEQMLNACWMAEFGSFVISQKKLNFTTFEQVMLELSQNREQIVKNLKFANIPTNGAQRLFSEIQHLLI